MRSIPLVLVVVLALTALSGCGGGGGDTTPGPANVLIVHAVDPAYVVDVAGKLSALGVLGTIEAFDAAAGTPDLPTLRLYDAVLVMSDDDFADTTALGNALADYVDAGGGVVLSMFSMGDFATGWSAGRRWSPRGTIRRARR